MGNRPARGRRDDLLADESSVRCTGLAILDLAALIVSVSCGGTPVSGPPAIRLGLDLCDGCGMTISEARHAAALTDAAGERPTLLFDDIGCLARYDARTDSTPSGERWVHDYRTGEWVAISAATFVRGAAISTPMGSGVAAFASASDADGLAADRGAERLTWERIRAMADAGTLHTTFDSLPQEGTP